MDGARLILNARYFHIAQTGEKATKYAFVAEAAAGLVNYIATRESVIYNYDEHYKEVSATEAQREAINQFLEVSPDLELSREFKAYDEDRSAANASALISRAAQYVYGMTAEGDVKPSAPATRAQRERIQEFVNKVPAIRQTPEYSDYKASPTRENASEVLSHALEVGLANSADPETLEIMLNYIAERPGVVHNEGKVHGLFTVNGAADLAAEKEAIAAHTGNIYSMVFSLRREDADRLGYDRQDAWSQLFAIKADKIAQALRVPTSKLHWVAAVHNTKHHPHAHFIAYSTEQKSRIYLSEDAIEQLKSEFVSEIFAEERHQIFAPREEARQQLEDRLETLFTQLEHNSNAAVTDLLLPEKLAALRKSIESASGRHVYKAAAYFEFAYRSGYKHAAYYLGNLYFHGKLSPADKPDYERAAGWYMANTENPYCQFALAKMIEHGQGFTPNVETAETLYRKCLNANDYLTAESSYAIAQMQLINLYIDMWRDDPKRVDYHSRAERYAKALANSIVHTKGFDGGGQNSYFYDSSEGLITSIILLVAQYCKPEERHIVSVFKILLEFVQTVKSANDETDNQRKVKQTKLNEILSLLPEDDKIRWFAGSVPGSEGMQYLSVITTSMSRLLAFIDSESENILCKNSKITVADIYQKKVAVFITFPEEDATKHVLVSLFLSQIINEAIVYADERTKENKLTRRLYIFADEFGIFPYMGNILGMFGASRSRNIIIVPCIQSPAQLRQTYGADGETIIRDCCQTVIFGGFSPMSDTAVTFSKLLGNQTVAAGSVSTNNREGRSLFGSGSNSSRSVNMIARPLMTPDELQLLPFGKWVVNRRGSHPFIANMPRYDKWGIRLEAPYISETREYVPTVYAKLDDVIRTIKEEKWRQTVQEKRESANPSESVGSTADY